MPIKSLLGQAETKLQQITIVSKRYPIVSIVAAGCMLGMSGMSALGLFTDLTIVQFYDTIPLPPVIIEGKLEWMENTPDDPGASERVHLIALWDMRNNCSGAQLVQSWSMADGSIKPAWSLTSSTGTNEPSSTLKYPPEIGYEGIFYKTFSPPPNATFLQWSVVATSEQCADNRARTQNVGVIQMPPKSERFSEQD